MDVSSRRAASSVRPVSDRHICSVQVKLVFAVLCLLDFYSYRRIDKSVDQGRHLLSSDFWHIYYIKDKPRIPVFLKWDSKYKLNYSVSKTWIWEPSLYFTCHTYEKKIVEHDLWFWIISYTSVEIKITMIKYNKV